MAVEVDGHGRPDPVAHFANQKFDGFGAAGADGVHDYDFGGAGFESGEINSLQKVEFGAGAVDCEESGCDSVLLGDGHRVHDAPQHVFAGHAVGFQLDVAGGGFDYRGSQT